jgi:RNA polymerase sigma-70 factor (ECF subfamily)
MMDEETDRRVRKVLEGDREAYRGIVSRHEAMVRVVIAAMLPDPSLVEDAAQEVFVTAYLKLGDYTPGTDFESWLKAFARNVALNERRRWFRGLEAARQYRGRIEEIFEPACDAAAGRMGDEILAGLRDCVKELPPRARQMVHARYFEDRSSREIATTQKQAEPWVRVALFRVRQALADCLAKKGLAQNG